MTHDLSGLLVIALEQAVAAPLLQQPPPPTPARA